MTPAVLGDGSAPQPSPSRVGDGDGDLTSAATVSHLEPLALTLGRGVHRPRGLRVFFLPLPDAPSGFERLLERLPAQEEEGWLSLNTFDGDYRRESGWESASCVGVDIDYYDDEGEHAALPAGIKNLVLDAAIRGDVPGHLIHATPRGFRVLRLFASQVSMRRVRDQAVVALADEVESAVRRLQVAARTDPSAARPRSGVVIDRAALDAARLFFRPSCVVRGATRNFRVVRTPEAATGGRTACDARS